LAEKFVWAIAQVMVRALFLSGHDTVIIDATNNTKKRRDEWQSSDWETLFKCFDAPDYKCKERAVKSGREDLIPVIERMWATREPLEGGERQISQCHDERGWIGVDLDGTLAEYNGWQGPDNIGDPVPLMVDRVKKWIADGKRVKIFTARCYYGAEASETIKKWLVDRASLPRLEVTNVKDFKMIELWDDRCRQVEKNTGMEAVAIENVSRETPEGYR